MNTVPAGNLLIVGGPMLMAIIVLLLHAGKSFSDLRDKRRDEDFVWRNLMLIYMFAYVGSTFWGEVGSFGGFTLGVFIWDGHRKLYSKITGREPG